VKDSNSSGDLYALVIGSDADDFIEYTTNLLGEYDIGFVVCEDIYRAVAELAKRKKSGNILVVGRINELNRETGQFFQKAGKYGCKFCCLTGKRLSGKDLRYLVKVETEVFIISEPGEVKEVVAESLTEVFNESELKKKSEIVTFEKEQLLTQAEMDALLES
jgi:hypothetical protein